MSFNLKENNKEKHLFKSYYCSSCNQTKPCGVLGVGEGCCPCYFQNWKERNKEYLDYQTYYQQAIKREQENFHQFQLLKSYQGCLKCGSLSVDAYSLYDKNKLFCQPCLMEKEGGSSSPISFSQKSKWYKKYWGIDLAEWLEKFQRLPVDAECADKWLKEPNHLENCQCLEKKVRWAVEDYVNSLKEYSEKLKKCACKTSPKVRVSSDDYAWCEKCDKSISVASKKRVIKNRNDPRFWGLNVSEKILCGSCLEIRKEKMPPLRKAEFNRYRKVKRL